MPPEPFTRSALQLDLSPRIAESHAVVGSPSGSTITSICALTVPGFNDIPVASGVLLEGWAAFTVGTSGVTAKLDIRQTGTAGAVIATTGALTVTATNLVAFSVKGIDPAPLAAGVWILALTIGSGAAASAVSGVELVALVV